MFISKVQKYYLPLLECPRTIKNEVMQVKFFNIALQGRTVRVSCYMSVKLTIYLARLDNELTAVLVNDGFWKSYGGDDENSTLKSAIMEWNAIEHDLKAKLDPSYSD